MAPKELRIEDLTREQKMHVLAGLLNDLHQEGVLSSHSLMAVASDVMYLDYQGDGDLLLFTQFTPENDDE